MTGKAVDAGGGDPSLDQALLSELERWRSPLARNAALRNPVLRSWELDAFVHDIITRAVYLRICEDRSLLPAGTLRDLAAATGIEGRISSLFLDAEGNTPLALACCLWEGAPAPTAREPVLDDQVLGRFLEALSPEGMPGDLPAIPPARLAGVFRILFRKEIRLRGGHRAILEETAAAKGAGGYPPPPDPAREFLVAHALEGTTGGEGREDPAHVRILDPACGAGQLLLLTCRHLLSRTGNRRTDGGAPPRNVDREERPGIAGSLFGVDPDPRAVVVTRMLLLLQAMDGEEGLVKGLCSPGLSAVCRTLREQIRCGNAVIGPEYLEEAYPRPSPRRVRELGIPLDWSVAFPGVVRSGGFDVVMMEPPTHHPGTEPGLRRYLQQHFPAYHDDADMAIYLMERGITLTSREGTFASLTPDRWLRARYGGPLRRILSTLQMEEMVLLPGRPPVPGGAAGDGHCILRLSPCPAGHRVRVLRVDPVALAAMPASLLAGGRLLDPASLGNGGWTFTDRNTRDLMDRVKRITSPLGRYVVGTLTCGDPAVDRNQALVDRKTRDRLIREDGRDPGEFHPVVMAAQLRRYAPVIPDRYLAGKGLDGMPPETGRGGESALPAPGAILCTERGGIPVCTVDTSGAVAGGRVVVIPRKDLYLVGILNSTFSRFLFREQDGGISVRWLEQFPVYIPDFSLLDDTSRHDRLVTLVSRMLELHARMLTTAPGEGMETLQRRIGATDREIDELVYALYGLTEEEQRIVGEGAEG